MDDRIIKAVTAAKVRRLKRLGIMASYEDYETQVRRMLGDIETAGYRIVPALQTVSGGEDAIRND
jgi:hypothetical protein